MHMLICGCLAAPRSITGQMRGPAKDGVFDPRLYF